MAVCQFRGDASLPYSRNGVGSGRALYAIPSRADRKQRNHWHRERKAYRISGKAEQLPAKWPIRKWPVYKVEARQSRTIGQSECRKMSKLAISEWSDAMRKAQANQPRPE